MAPDSPLKSADNLIFNTDASDRCGIFRVKQKSKQPIALDRGRWNLDAAPPAKEDSLLPAVTNLEGTGQAHVMIPS